MFSNSEHCLFVVSLFSVFIFAASSTNGTATPGQCDYINNIGNIYRSPNASQSYQLPAVVQPLGSGSNISTAPISTSPTFKWQLTNTLGLEHEPHLQEPQLERTFFLDTTSNGNNTNAVPSVLAGCSVVFRLPASDNGKASANGDCSNLITQSCVDDIKSSVKALSQSIAASHSMPFEQACSSISSSLFTLPKSCPNSKTGTADNFSVSESQGLNFTFNFNDGNCSGAPPQNANPIYDEYVTYQPENLSTYDQIAKEATPILLVLFSNGTLFTGPPFADAQLLCTSPKSVAPGSRVPSNAADQGQMVNMNLLVGVAVALNALFFLTV